MRHFGYEFKYGANNVDPRTPLSEGIPECCREFLTRALDLGLVQHFPDQLTVNQYLPGQGVWRLLSPCVALQTSALCSVARAPLVQPKRCTVEAERDAPFLLHAQGTGVMESCLSLMIFCFLFCCIICFVFCLLLLGNVLFCS